MAENVNEKLFGEFTPNTTQEWKEKVIADLKGADFDKKLFCQNSFDCLPCLQRNVRHAAVRVNAYQIAEPHPGACERGKPAQERAVRKLYAVSTAAVKGFTLAYQRTRFICDFAELNSIYKQGIGKFRRIV